MPLVTSCSRRRKWGHDIISSKCAGQGHRRSVDEFEDAFPAARSAPSCSTCRGTSGRPTLSAGPAGDVFLEGSSGVGSRWCPKLLAMFVAMDVLWTLTALTVKSHQAGVDPWAVIAPAIPVGISLLAVGVSLLLWWDQRRQDKRNLFLKIHEALVDPDLQEGRRLLFARTWTQEDVEKCRLDRPNEYQLINRALAMLDIFALYVEKKYVIKQMVLEEWSHIVTRAATYGQPFIEDRAARHQFRPFPHLQGLAEEADGWAINHPRP